MSTNFSPEATLPSDSYAGCYNSYEEETGANTVPRRESNELVHQILIKREKLTFTKVNIT